MGWFWHAGAIPTSGTMYYFCFEQSGGGLPRASGDSQESGRPLDFATKIIVSVRRRGISATVFSRPLGLAQYLALHRLFDFLPARTRLEIQLSLECVESEKITMRLARRRTGTVVADLAEVVAPLPLAARQFVNLGYAFGQTGDSWLAGRTAPSGSRFRKGRRDHRQ